MTQQKNVLIVDDEPEVALGVTVWLSAAGYGISTAGDGDAALRDTQSNPPEAIVLDVRMPKKTGLQTLAELKQIENTKNIPVVMLSASLIDQQRALDAGARFFLKKPYDGKELVCAVNAALTDHNTQRSTDERIEPTVCTDC